MSCCELVRACTPRCCTPPLTDGALPGLVVRWPLTSTHSFGSVVLLVTAMDCTPLSRVLRLPLASRNSAWSLVEPVTCTDCVPVFSTVRLPRKLSHSSGSFALFVTTMAGLFEKSVVRLPPSSMKSGLPSASTCWRPRSWKPYSWWPVCWKPHSCTPRSCTLSCTRMPPAMNGAWPAATRVGLRWSSR